MGLAGLVFFLFIGFFGEDGVLKLRQYYLIRDQIIADNHNLLQQNLLYLQEIQKLGDAKYIEQLARRELGYVKADEIVFVVPEE